MSIVAIAKANAVVYVQLLPSELHHGEASNRSIKEESLGEGEVANVAVEYLYTRSTQLVKAFCGSAR